MLPNAYTSVGDKPQVGGNRLLIGQGDSAGPFIDGLAELPELCLLVGGLIVSATAA